MKTYILQLEAHDDIISACDKMGWAKSRRILLVWPENGRVLHRRLDLVLLKRQSQLVGAQLALVTKDPDVRYHAPRLGILVFKDLRKAQSGRWRLPRRFRHLENERFPRIPTYPNGSENGESPPIRKPILYRPNDQVNTLNPIAKLIFFTLGVLAFLSIAATLLPSAQVTLSPKTKFQEITIAVSANPDVETINISGEIPAHRVSVIVEGRDTLPASGSIRIPDRPAIGYVTFTNLTNQSVPIPEGTVVRSQSPNAIRFVVTQAGTLSASPGESITLPVRSLTLGKSSNLPQGSIEAIEGPLGTMLTVANSEAMRHGSDRLELAPTATDRQELLHRLQNALESSALTEIGHSIEDGDLLIPSSLKLLNLLEESYQPQEESPANILSLNLRLEFEALVIREIDLHTLAETVMDANLPAGYLPLNGKLEFDQQTAPELGDESIIRFKVKFQRPLLAQLPEPHAVRLSLGLAPEQARQRLEAALPLGATPEIKLFPTWWPRLPILPFRINIIERGAE